MVRPLLCGFNMDIKGLIYLDYRLADFHVFYRDSANLAESL